METITAPLDMDARYSVAGMPGVAFWLSGYATTWTEESWTLDCPEDHDPDHEHEGCCYLYSEPEEVTRDDMVCAVMVGDDRTHLIDVADLILISEEDYCHECGQTGCTADGR